MANYSIQIGNSTNNYTIDCIKGDTISIQSMGVSTQSWANYWGLYGTGISLPESLTYTNNTAVSSPLGSVSGTITTSDIGIYTIQLCQSLSGTFSLGTGSVTINVNQPTELLTTDDTYASETAKTSSPVDGCKYLTVNNKEYLLAQQVSMQDFYNAIYPVGTKIIGFSTPTVPSGVTATWTVDSSYDGRALWIDNNSTPGTLVNGEAPNVVGSWTAKNYTNNTVPFQIGNTGVFSTEKTTSTDESLTWSGSGTNMYAQLDFDAFSSSIVYSGVAGTDVLRPNSTVVHIWSRTA